MKCKKLAYFLLVLIFSTFSLQDAQSASSLPIRENASATTNPTPPSQALRLAQMKWFAGLSLEQYQQLKGRKLNFFERLSFRMSQKRMKKMLQHYDYGDVTTLQKISWLLKGLLLGPIAVLLAYIFLQDEERELIKWVWIGFAGFAAAILIILLVV